MEFYIGVPLRIGLELKSGSVEKSCDLTRVDLGPLWMTSSQAFMGLV